MAAVGSLADAVCAFHLGHPTRVAVDGVSAAGKTTLVAELRDAVAARSRAVVTVSLDGFHFDRERRYRQGRRSAVGYYEDAFDVHAVVTRLLVPLGPGGDRRYRQQVFDLTADRPVEEPAVEAEEDAVVLVDGSFLQRPELAPHWDYRVFVDTDPQVARARSARRDAALLGGEQEALDLYDERYLPAFRRYAELVGPDRVADVVLENDEPSRPRLRWRGAVGPDRP